MTDLAGLVQRLDQIADRVRDRGDETVEQYFFGARSLRIHSIGKHDTARPSLGLVPCTGADGGVGMRGGADLYDLTVTDVDELGLPRDGVRAAYGAMPESLATEWLILWEPDTGKLLALHRQRRIGLWQPGSVLPPRERAEYCRPLLHWLAVLDGNVVVHAAAVSVDGRGVLVAGAGNAGKSTLARVCLSDGWDVLGDNVVELAANGEGAFRILPVYPTFKVRPGGVLPIPASWPTPEWDEEARKDIYFLGDALAPAFTRGATELVATLVLDENGGQQPRSISRAEAFFRVAPNTVAQFPFFEQEALTRTGMVIGAAPHFSAGRMPLGDIPSVMAGLLARAGGAEVLA